MGQDQFHDKISLLVLDKNTHQGIGNANVVLKDSNKGAATLPNGFCNLTVNHFPIKLIVSHVAYYDSEIAISRFGEDTITIFLEPRMNTLEEIVVSGTRERVIPKDFYIIDFSICESKVFVLGFYNNVKRNYEVKILNTLLEHQHSLELTDTILAERLFTDCFNQCHILTKSSAYQIIKTDTTWDVCCKYEIDSFHEIMDDCLFQTKKYVFFKRIGNGGYTQSFYGVDLETKKSNHFIQNDDISRFKQLADELNFLKRHPPSIRMEFEVRFVKEFMYKPYRDALINFGDTIFHFNFKDGKIDYYSAKELKMIGATKLDSSLISSVWNDELIFDKVERKAFIIWKMKLYEINTVTGKLIARNKIKPSYKQLISGGHIFYLTGIENPVERYKMVTREKIQ